MTDDEVYGHLKSLLDMSKGIEATVGRSLFDTKSVVNRSLLSSVINVAGRKWYFSVFLTMPAYVATTRSVVVSCAHNKEQMASCFDSLISEIQMSAL